MFSLICAPSTASGPSAIAVIRVSGQGCAEALDRVFKAKCGLSCADRTPAKLYYGTLFDKTSTAVDLCMSAFFKAPASYTGEDMAEIYIHGSEAVMGCALEALTEAGCRMAEAGEFTKRAFLNGKMDLVDAEAAADLIGAQSARAAQNAVSIMSGMGRELDGIRQELLGICAHYYAVCDYPDEEIDPFSYSETGKKLKEQGARLGRLAESYERGKLVQNGVPVALIGKPNAGKSSLFNRLVGFERAIVTEEEGTTRDVIEQRINCGGCMIRLLDTAGLRDADGKAEKIGVELSIQAARQASAVIWVFDGSETDPRYEKRVLDELGSKPVLAVFNKDDLSPGYVPGGGVKFEQTARVSALTGEGMDKVLQWLSSLVPDASEGAVITSARQAALLKHAAQCLDFAAEAAARGMTADAFLSDVQLAAVDLGQLSGRDSSVDMAAEIFSRFCVGK